jgi:hypothetical protein
MLLSCSGYPATSPLLRVQRQTRARAPPACDDLRAASAALVEGSGGSGFESEEIKKHEVLLSARRLGRGKLL